MFFIISFPEDRGVEVWWLMHVFPFVAPSHDLPAFPSGIVVTISFCLSNLRF